MFGWAYRARSADALVSGASLGLAQAMGPIQQRPTGLSLLGNPRFTPETPRRPFPFIIVSRYRPGMGDQIEVPLRCPACGCEGMTVWERDTPARVSIVSSDRFYLRMRVQRTTFRTEIACGITLSFTARCRMIRSSPRARVAAPLPPEAAFPRLSLRRAVGRSLAVLPAITALTNFSISDAFRLSTRRVPTGA
jgi:hypothetical protein